MYEFINGKIAQKKAAQIVLENNGIGYVLKTSLSTSQNLPAEGEDAQLFTYLHVREDVSSFMVLAAKRNGLFSLD